MAKLYQVPPLGGTAPPKGYLPPKISKKLSP